MASTFQTCIEKLTGQKVPLQENVSVLDALNPKALGLGYSQFNELLLFLGYDRVSVSFFQFLVDGTVDFKQTATISGLNELTKNVDKTVEYSLRLFGNEKFGYKQLSTESGEVEFQKWYYLFQPIARTHYTERHLPLFPIKKIPQDETFFLGYLIQAEIEQKLWENPADPEALEMQAKMHRVISSGVKNHKAYLASDHMDVYVATSMRQKHEYLFISRIADQIFLDRKLAELKVRYFDPTQAYCPDRIDKGIAEALMLKRAKCTIYLAQESDTLGKDSELASTLAQGKTVIAYVPKGDKEYVDNLLADLTSINKSKPRKEIILEQLRVFNPDLCWTDKKMRDWIDSKESDEKVGMAYLYDAVKTKYDSRARTLKDTHPLGIQVNLETGVANGVIVTREISECVELVRQVLLLELEFEVIEEIRTGIPYLLLKEKLTKSIYRVSTGEKLLANTFWNYYLPK